VDVHFSLPSIRFVAMSAMPRAIRSGAFIALMAMVATAGLWWRSHQRAHSMNVVIVTLDTTRADRLSPYGFMDASMPTLERLAREGVVFDQATSVAPLTLPAHVSLFTGLFPPSHGVRDNADPPLTAAHTTLADVLSEHGFRTGAFVGASVLEADRGLAQGFGIYRSDASIQTHTPETRQRRAGEVIGDATRWLDEIGDARFFLWTHLYDPHRPYDPPEPFRSRFVDPYIGEIAFADSQIGRLLDALDRRDLLERTIVIVAGDHGESLGEHGERDHGIFVYESVLRVPLMIRAPGVLPRRVGAIVRLTDVMPTLLDLLGLPAPKMDGVSLVDLVDGRKGTLDLEAYSESFYPQRFGWSPLRALRDGRYKLIDAPRPELYDLERDLFEEHNVYEERRTVAETLHQRLASHERREAGSDADIRQEASASPGTRERLAALGYVGTASKRETVDRHRLPDPKDCIAHYNARRDLAPSVTLEAEVPRCN
jgi:choline-sulfatase